MTTATENETTQELVPQEEPATALAESPVPAMMGLIERALTDENISLEKLERLLQMREDWLKAEAARAFTAAMARFKAKMPTYVKGQRASFDSRSGGRVSYTHATLGELVEAVTPPLAEEGLSLHWTTDQRSDRIFVTAHLTHRDGHTESVTMDGPLDNSGQKNPIQQIGATLTYLRRYTGEQITGVAPAEDADGNDESEGYRPQRNEGGGRQDRQRRQQLPQERRNAQQRPQNGPPAPEQAQAAPEGADPASGAGADAEAALITELRALVDADNDIDMDVMAAWVDATAGTDDRSKRRQVMAERIRHVGADTCIEQAKEWLRGSEPPDAAA